jgi:hypothetical protein
MAEKVGGMVPSSESPRPSWLPQAVSSINMLRGHRALCVGRGRSSGAGGWSDVGLEGRKGRRRGPFFQAEVVLASAGGLVDQHDPWSSRVLRRPQPVVGCRGMVRRGARGPKKSEAWSLLPRAPDRRGIRRRPRRSTASTAIAGWAAAGRRATRNGPS